MIRPLVLAPLALALVSSPALAHFKLVEPKPDRSPDPQGKAAPCGDNAPRTTDVTNYTPGQMLTLRLEETVPHPGHYRVAIAQNEASLPAPPPVTPVGNDPCGSAPITTNPTLPILADGLFVNLTPQMGVQSVQVQLPAGMTCTNCVLQVIEFMSNHDPSCFYYHCAKVNVSASAPDAGPPSGDAGTGGNDAGTNPNNEATGGCGCASNDGSGALALFAALGLFMAIRRRGSRPSARD